MMDMHVAGMNIGLLGDPRMAGFAVTNGKVTAVADRGPRLRAGLDRVATLRAYGLTDAAYDFKYLRHKMQAEASE